MPDETAPLIPPPDATWWNSTEPFGMPAGSVRALLAATVIVSYIAAVFTGKLPATGLEGMAQLAFGVYIGLRTATNGKA